MLFVTIYDYWPINIKGVINPSHVINGKSTKKEINHKAPKSKTAESFIDSAVLNPALYSTLYRNVIEAFG